MEKKNINEVIANLSVEQLAGMIDHTFLKPFGTAENIEKLCAEARQYKFAMVAINPAEVETCVKLLEGSGVRVGAAIGFPLGQNTVECKAFETRDAIAKGYGHQCPCFAEGTDRHCKERNRRYGFYLQTCRCDL